MNVFIFALVWFVSPQQYSTAEVEKNTLGVGALIRPHYGRPVGDRLPGVCHFDCI